MIEERCRHGTDVELPRCCGSDGCVGNRYLFFDLSKTGIERSSVTKRGKSTANSDSAYGVPTILRQRLLKTSEPGASSLKRSLHDREGAPIQDHSVQLTLILDSSGIFAPRSPRRVITKHY